MSSNGRYEALAYHEDLPVPVMIRPLRSARRLRMRFDENRRLLKLTCPARTSRRAALAWAAEQRSWVEAQIASALPDEPLRPGSVIPLEGEDITLCWDEQAPRRPLLEAGVLTCGGPASGFARRIRLFLRGLAFDRLSADTARYAALAGASPRSVSIGDADTRWGSCSSQGRIRYSWRLILAPPDIRRYVAAHEVAHLVHLNHGPGFRALESRLFEGDPAAARDLLRVVGPRLKRIGRGD